MRTKLDVLPPPKDSGKYDHVAVRVAIQQGKSKHYTAKKRGAKASKVTVGDKVRVCKPFRVGKGERQYNDPMSVEQQTGLSTFVLTEGHEG